jgi:hypothetical protein
MTKRKARLFPASLTLKPFEFSNLPGHSLDLDLPSSARITMASRKLLFFRLPAYDFF